MSIDGVLQQPVRFRATEKATDDTARNDQPVSGGRANAAAGDIIDIKAMKAILYLGLRGDVYLPMEEAHLVDTRA